MKPTLTIFLLFIFVSLLNAQNYVQTPIPRDTSFTVYNAYQKIKKDFPQAIPAKPILPNGVKAKYDVIYATLENTRFGKRELHVDIFHPEKEGKYPGLIMVFGGAWRSGNKSMQVPMAMQIAAKGYVTVAVEYQLGLEARFPAAVQNIKAAIRWMRANADQYNIDTSKIAISGCSAGGQLASLVGMTNGVEKFEGDQGNPQYSSSVQAVINVDGLLNFLAPVLLNKDRSPESADVQWMGGDFYEKPGVWKDASPIFWVNEKSVPIMFLNSGFPRFHAGRDEMIAILKKWNIYTEIHTFDIKLHPFWLFHPWFDQTVKYMVNFLDKEFKGADKTDE